MATSTIDPGIAEFALTNGSVSSTTDVLPGGSYSVTAHYPGDGDFSASDSAPVAVTVTPEGSKTAVSFITQTVQGNILPFSSGPYGTPVYLRADVSGNSGNGTPTGTVTFLDGGNSITGIPALTLNSQGNVLPTNPTYTFAAGTHSITAGYSGDPSFNSSTSPANSFMISQAVTTFQGESGSTRADLGATVPLSEVLNASTAGNPPTGTVTFTSTSTSESIQLASVAVSGTVNPTQHTATAYINASTTQLPVGQNTIVAKYSGDANYSAATSAPYIVNIVVPTTTTLSASASSIQQGQSVTLAAKVTSNQPGEPALTGTVLFAANSVSLGTSALSNGQAQITTTALPSGTVTVTAEYSGDTNFDISVGSLTESVAPGADFSIAFSPTVLNVSSPGASANTMLTVTGSNGYSGTINFSAASCSGLPSESSCSFSSASVTGNGSTTLTVSTTAPSVLVPASRHIEVDGWPTTGALRFILFGLALFALGIQACGRRWNVAGMALVLVLLVVNAACGGGGGGSTGPTNSGTPQVKNQVITVTATSGTTTHTFTFTLNVN
jgi:Bacterial Ig-like domain (group 3)